MALRAILSHSKLRAVVDTDSLEQVTVFANIKALTSFIKLNYGLDFVNLSAANILLDADSKNLYFAPGYQDDKALTLVISENQVYNLGKALSDTPTLSESHAASIGKALSDSPVISEAFSRIVTYSRDFSDTPTISESLASLFSKALSETTAISESETKAVGKAINDTQVSDQTFTVTVVSTGSGNKYYIDGVQQATLSLIAGATYRFDQSDSSNSGHPLRLSTTSNGTHGGGSEHLADPDVTTNGTPGQAGAYTEINLDIFTESMASTFFYYCSIHSGMGGQINVTTTGDISMSESLARQVSFVRALSDAYTLDDTASASDDLQTDINMQKGNVFSVSDAPALSTESALSDTQAIAEQAALTVAKALADNLTMSEASLVGSGAILSDTPSLAEAIQSLNSSKSLSDSATISESLSILFVSGASSVLNTAALNTSVLN